MADKLEGGAFSKKDSLALKGIAILMMIWHHCFLSGRFEKYGVDLWPLTQGQVVHIAALCKICVSLFAFISGYGLYLTWKKAKAEYVCTSRWIGEKLVRTLSSYWFVIVLAWVVCASVDGRPYQVYGFEQSTLLGLWNMLIEFLGLTNLVGSQPMNGTWWYMSAAVAYVFLLPLLCKGFEQIGCFCTLGVVFLAPRAFGGCPGGVHFLSFLPVFCIGMIFARQDLFGKWDRLWEGKRVWIRCIKLLGMLCGMLVIYKLFYRLDTTVWWDVK